jgi:peptidyl-prolyl cis-trans isomerase C
LLAVALLVAAPALAKDEAKTKAKQPPDPNVLARVGGEKITEEQVQEILDRMSPVGRPPDAKKRILDNIIELQVFALEAKKAGLADDPEVKKRLKEVTTVVMARSFFDKCVAGKAEVTDEAAKVQYEANKAAYMSPAQVHFSQIMAKDKKTAEQLLARLKKGASFEELAKKESKDPMTAPRGGEMGWQTLGSFDPALDAAAAKLKAGELSGPIETRRGFHILKLVERRDKQQLTFDQIKNIIKESMKRGEVDKLRKQYLDKADVEVFYAEEPPAEEPAVEKALTPEAAKPAPKDMPPAAPKDMPPAAPAK